MCQGEREREREGERERERAREGERESDTISSSHHSVAGFFIYLKIQQMSLHGVDSKV